MEISVAGEGDLDELLPLMRAYCDFYDVAPSDEDLLALSRALIADPGREGVQLIARGDDGAAARRCGEAARSVGGQPQPDGPQRLSFRGHVHRAGREVGGLAAGKEPD
ncbi:MAG TPA: hypothetical protein VFY44_05015, partial [Thermoleophilaceae bacterium]|nr:hypothetical protein [Thermoleophilaceae bacterium]